ncbi:enoyl-CoA hydratase/isomerase family protein [Mycetocola zhujimingii]|uniref:enoyl-CoA hydratase/isomerase family protein n=1 Tax=Mycetocola zhujimingii TaxID=2079792 RepID=UPI000D39268A|nr:enoyl-CoA hydratase/isomerase family protein [Mycetocola zhujimingii]AWB87656.1 enoyl-CoA hydratase [Mycetocola zhujimingii]
MTKFLRFTCDGPVAELELANPPLNLVTTEMLGELLDVVSTITQRHDILALIVHGGDGRAFCAGSDMTEFASVAERAAERKILPEDHALRLLASLPMPTIAAIDGPALGGGLELALACDIRVAHSTATLGLTETRIGGLAASGAVRLTTLIGPSRALELLVTGRVLSARDAERWGVVNQVSETATALETARVLAAEIAARGPLSNRLAKQLVNAAVDLPLDAALSQGVRAQELVFRSSDLREGTASFFEKRRPEFSGA